MSAWDELTAKYKAGAAASDSQRAAEPDQVDVWRSLAATHRVPAQTADSQKPDNSAIGMAKQRMVMDMPAYDRAAAQLGAGLTDVALGLEQIAGKATAKDADEKRTLDKELKAAPGGGVLGFTGNVAPTLAIPAGVFGNAVSRFLPWAARAAPAVEGAAQGSITSGIQPVGAGESRAFNAAVGAVGGAALPGAVTFGRTMAGNMSPEAAALAQRAIRDYRIPLQASDLTDSRAFKALNSAFSDMPITGSIANSRNAAKASAFNRGVARTIGEDADRLTPEVASRAYNRLQSNYRDIYSRNPADSFSINAAIQPTLARVAQEGTDEQRRIIRNRLDELYRNIDAQTGQIDGNFFNRWQSDLRETASSRNDDLIAGFRRNALQAYNQGLTGEDAALLAATNAQYRNYKTIEPLINKAQDGNISPGLLQGRVASNFNDYGRGGAGELGDLARIGSRFLVDRTPQTGGSARALLQNGTLATGAGVGGAVGGIPGALVGAAMPIATVGTANTLLNNNFMRNSMIRNALTVPAAPRGLLDYGVQPTEMVSEIVRRGLLQASPAAAVPGLLAF